MNASKRRTNLFVCFLIAACFGCIFFSGKIYSKNLTEDEQLIKVGIGAFKDGFYDIAETQFSQFMKGYSGHPKTYDVCYLLGKTLLIKEKLKEAKSVFQKIAAEDKNFEYLDCVYFWLAEIELKLSNNEEASRLYLTLINKYPKFEWIDYCYYFLGQIDFSLNKLPQSESYFRKVPLLSNNTELVRSSQFWLGILAFKKKDYESASVFFQTIWEDPKPIRLDYRRVALFWLGEAKLKAGSYANAKAFFRIFYERFKNDPLSSDVFWRLGFCDYRLGNIKEATDCFQSFKQESKDSSLRFNALYFLGEMFLLAGDYTSSIKELNAVLSSPQGNSLWGVSFLALYWNYFHIGDTGEANKVYQKVQKTSRFEDEKTFFQWLIAEVAFSEGRISDALPYYFNILNTRFRERALLQIGKTYFFDNKFREAVTNLDLLLLEFPNSLYAGEGLFIKGECLNGLGDSNSALETYDLIVKQNRSTVWQLFALTQIGNLALIRNETGKAERAFRKILEISLTHPLSSNAAFQLGNIYFRKKNIVEAFQYYSLVLKGDISDLFGQTYFGLGEIFYQQGKYDKAFKCFETGVEYLKENSLGFFLTRLEIGNLQSRLGKTKEARTSYMSILNQSKDEEIRKAAKELLDRLESK
jgi:TolA-binding protein